MLHLSLHWLLLIDNLTYLNQYYYLYIILSQFEFTWIHTYWCKRSPHGVVVNVLDCSISRKQIWPIIFNFWTNTFENGMKSLIPFSNGLNSTTTVLLQGWLWHLLGRSNGRRELNPLLLQVELPPPFWPLLFWVLMWIHENGLDYVWSTKRRMTLKSGKRIWN